MINETPDSNSRYFGIHVAVLGAAGFIGRWVARVLCTQGARVHLIVRDKGAAEQVFSQYGIHGEILELDLRNSDMVAGLFQEIRPSITFNLVGYGVDPLERDEETAHRINAHLVKTFCEGMAVRRDLEWLGQDLIHVGSALEYGAINGDLSEDSVPNPTTLYGKSKLAGTCLLAHCCESYQLKGLTARLFTVYGPGEHPVRLLPSLLEAGRTGKPLEMTSGVQKRDFTYIEDVAEGLLHLGLAAVKPGEIVNLATGRLISVRAFAETAASLLQLPYAKLKFGSISTRAEEMQHSEVVLERLRRLVAWVPPTGVAEGIRKTIDFETLQRNGDG